MEEVTIKINKTVLFVVAALIIGVGLGYGGSSFLGKNTSANPPDAPQIVGDNKPPAPDVKLEKDDHIIGASNPKAVIITYTDFECPYCGNLHTTMQKVLQNYGNKVALAYRHYPLSFHANAEIAAQASECAAEQGKFWEYADVLFQKTGTEKAFFPSNLEKYAADLGLGASFNTCLRSKKYADEVQSDLAEGSGYGVQGTPGSFLIDKNGNVTIISGALPYESIKASIDSVL
ncbi:DsbA family protein [Patescibacteria group bacterium]